MSSGICSHFSFSRGVSLGWVSVDVDGTRSEGRVNHHAQSLERGVDERETTTQVTTACLNVVIQVEFS